MPTPSLAGRLQTAHGGGGAELFRQVQPGREQRYKKLMCPAFLSTARRAQDNMLRCEQLVLHVN